jgi:hypothetical protein
VDEQAGTMRGLGATLGCLLVTAPMLVAFLVAVVGVFSFLVTS